MFGLRNVAIVTTGYYVICTYLNQEGSNKIWSQNRGDLGGWVGKFIDCWPHPKYHLMNTLSATHTELDFYSGSSLKQTWTMR